MKFFLVGGAVRDRLLGLSPGDRDWVVIGATPEQMGAAGYLPVGHDFPVFLHPRTREEYALARIERKTAPGYRGFSFRADPDVTLEEDLSRRDLTLNAMAMDDDGTLIDPWGGQADLRDGVLRHVGPAFVEDPVRILRLARFLARFTTFRVAPETLALCRTMVAAGEVDALVPERVWQELSRGLMEERPSRMFAVLRDCGALARILPELDVLWGVPQPPLHHPEVDTGVHIMLVIDYAASQNHPLEVRFAALVHDLGKGVSPSESWPAHHGHEFEGMKLVTAVCKRLKVPNECRDLAQLTAREHGNVSRALELRANTIVSLFERCDAFRKPERFAQMLLASECDARGRGHEGHPMRLQDYPQRPYLLRALDTARAVNAGEVAARYAEKRDKIPEAVHAARVSAVKAALREP